MNTQSKKFIIIVSLIFIVIAIGVGIYFALKNSVPANTSTEQSTNGLPSNSDNSSGSNLSEQDQEAISLENSYNEQKQRLFVLGQEEIVGYWLSDRSTSTASSTDELLKQDVYGLTTQGDIIKIINQDKQETLVSSDFGTPYGVIQNQKGDKVIVVFESGYYIFDLNKKNWEKLDDRIISASFSPDGKKIAYLKAEAGGETVYIKDLTKTKINLTKVVTLAIDDFGIYWGQTDLIYFVSKQANKYIGEIWSINLKTKTFSKLFTDYALGVVFSQKYPYGLKISTSKTNQTKFSIFSSAYEETASLPLVTVSDKCSFSFDSEFIYCSVPYANNVGSSFLLPNDYLKKSTTFKDNFYKINFKNGQYFSVINIPSLSLDAVSLKEKNNQLFFINRLDNKLYMYKI